MVERAPRAGGSSVSKSFISILLLFSTLLVGCETSRVDPVPEKVATQAVIPGIAEARYFVPGDSERLAAEYDRSAVREREYYKKTAHRDLPTAYFLALSGGADDGAYGAGFLNGWTQAGTRPQFKLVTGISTGALIAPFAFLGPSYDAELKEVFTTINADSVFKKRFVTAALTDDALANTAPLYALISKHLNEEMVSRIAAEYDKGRLLLIMTTDLDAAKSVIWNIGAIAKHGGPQAIETIRKVLLASAAIPAAFPPVMFNVEYNGNAYQELHVDGGAVAQSFLYTPGVHLKQNGRKRVAYIIRNSRLSPTPDKVDKQTISIAGRAISLLISASGIGDMYRMYANTQRDHVDYNLTYIGTDFTEPYPGMFDQTYMRSLFDYGYQKARNGHPWDKAPPGLLKTPTETASR
nr:patatin-like phospholipase family protein [Rhizobium leucaenae]